MPHCTLRQPRSDALSNALSDRLWDRDQQRQSSYIAAEEHARTRTDRIASILAGFTFTQDEQSTLFRAGLCVQAGMQIVSKSDPRDRYLVTCKLMDGTEEWSACCPPFRQEHGPLMIAAVRARIRAARVLAGKAAN
jgi:hypothetical protein